MRSSIILAMLSAGFLLGPVAAANAQGTSVVPLSGGVSVNDYAAPPQSNRIPRGVAPFAMQLLQEYQQATQQREFGSVDPTQFASPAPTRFSAGIAQAQPQRAMAPYVWCQSNEGGYYDETGHAKTNVWAAELYKFGGRFKDGTPVPARPITNFNAMGHAYKTMTTSGPSFWDR